MTVNDLLDRISVDPRVCHGQPCLKSTRIMVYLILELLESGLSAEKTIPGYYPNLTKQDIEACLHYAATLIRDTEYVPYPMAT